MLLYYYMRIFSLFALLCPSLSIFLGNLCTPVYIALRQQNTHVLPQLLQTISEPTSSCYGTWLTSEELHDIIDAAQSDQQQVVQWASSYNVEHLRNHGDAISFCAPSASLVNMFNIPIKFHGGSLLLKNYTIPQHLKNSISFVEMYAEGLNSGVKQRPLIKPHDSVDNRYFGREPLQKIYHTPQELLNISIITAAIEFQNNQGYTLHDMNQQRALNSLNSSTVQRTIGENNGYDMESELDVQMLSMASVNSELWYWNNPYWLFSFAVEFEKTMTKPNIISLSWGWSERNQCDIIDCVYFTSEEYVARVNTEFLKMALQGTTIVISSGDAGAPGRTNEDCDSDSPINPVFPGSSPYVLSVGATFIVKDNSTSNYSSPLCKNQSCVTGTEESTISYDNLGWTAGGGFDAYRNMTPWWQINAVNDYLTSGVILPPASSFNRNGRAYPDVAAVGHSCPTVINNGLLGIDGTSCSAPLIGGLLTYVWDTLWREHDIKLGFANPLLYHIYEHCPECFNDIKNGYNWCTESACCEDTHEFGFSSIDGYDPVSGLGTLNIEKIRDFITQMKF